MSHTDEDEIAAYLGMTECGHSFYSYVDPETGMYQCIGLIERVARFNDQPEGAQLFNDDLGPTELERLLEQAERAKAFQGVDPQTTRTILTKARHTERLTRHKFNPNCPTLGERTALLHRQILTDTLPAS